MGESLPIRWKQQQQQQQQQDVVMMRTMTMTGGRACSCILRASDKDKHRNEVGCHDS